MSRWVPDERGEEEHEQATERLLLRSQPPMLAVGEADGDVERQTAGDHEDVEEEHRAHHESVRRRLGRHADQLWIREVVRRSDLLDSPLALLG